VLRHCAVSEKRGLSALPNEGHSNVDVSVSGVTRRCPCSGR